MSGYIDLPIDADPDDLATDAISLLMERIPLWEPYDASIEVILVTVLARMVSEATAIASRVPKSIFRWYGKNLVNLPAIEAASSEVYSTWTMVDAAGYTVDAETVVAFQTAGDQVVTFRTVAGFTVSPGNVATLPGQVLLEAVDTGSDTNNLTGPMVLIDALAFVDTVTATTVSSGGVDAEDDDAYLDRLAVELEMLTPRPILAKDFAVLAQRTAGVARAFAIDNLNPADGTTNNERMVAVAVVGADGLPLSGAVKADVDTQLQAQREVNFIVNVIDPTYTPISVDTTVTAMEGYDHAALVLTVEAALADYLSPANWAGGDLTPPVWRTTATKVYYLELATLINNVEGVDRVTALTINGGGVDVALAGYAPLPSVGAMTCTVVA